MQNGTHGMSRNATVAVYSDDILVVFVLSGGDNVGFRIDALDVVSLRCHDGVVDS